MNSKLKSWAHGFTLIELLVVMLILAILMAVALPLYLTSVRDSQIKTCRSNMQSIAQAVQSHRLQTGLPYAAISSPVSATLPDLFGEPQCPVGGTYSVVVSGSLNDANGVSVAVPPGGYGVSCTVGVHGGFIPGSMGN